MKPILRLIRLTPATAEVAVECDEDAIEVRGRVNGPTCAYSTTIDVAYPIRGGRVVIPEPAWWDPESPFLYGGPVEFWRDGQRVGEASVRFGLSHSRRDGDRVICNGKPMTLRVEPLDAVDELAMRQLRAAGANAVTVAGESSAACAIADRIGMFVIADDSTSNTLEHPSAI